MQAFLVFAATVLFVPFLLACAGDRRSERAPMIGIPMFAIALAGVLTSNESPAAKGITASGCVLAIGVLWGVWKRRFDDVEA